jgi:hypothetical protein
MGARPGEFWVRVRQNFKANDFGLSLDIIGFFVSKKFGGFRFLLPQAVIVQNSLRESHGLPSTFAADAARVALARTAGSAKNIGGFTRNQLFTF